MRYARFAWAQLTSMRTALVLLFLLALAAVPGSLLPQRPVSPVRVAEFIADQPVLGRVADAVGLFDVYASPWFAAIYLLLFTSLIGCILPRVRAYARALRTPPAATPRRLARLDGHRTAGSDAPAAEVLAAAERHLRSRRFTVLRQDGSVAAERGRLREAGNLVFHVALVVVLVGVAWGALGGYRGTAAVVEGQAFSNTLTQYDDLSAGAAFSASQLSPFTVRLTDFQVRFETGPVQRGAARLFRAEVELATAEATTPAVLEVNHPLVIGDTSVHLVGHGYAPVVTVTDAQGQVAFSGPVVFLPQDGNFTSVGVIKAPDARPERLAFEGVFLPSAVLDEGGGRSVFPDAVNPELFLNAWSGPPRTETGIPESVYSLDPAGLSQLRTADGDLLRLRLAPGTTADLPGGGSIRFDEVRRWTKLQVSSTPGLPLVLGSVLVAVAGMWVSLAIRPRRVWLRVLPGGFEVAGLDRAGGRGGLDEELADLVEACGGGPGLADDGAALHNGDSAADEQEAT